MKTDFVHGQKGEKMSRLIDADALSEKLKEMIAFRTKNLSTSYDFQTILSCVEDMPTIEPERKKGHWIRHPEQRNIFNGKTIECSECHEKYTVQYVEDELFCRHCGADMRGENDNK